MSVLKILQITDLHILAKPEDTMLGVNTEYYFRETLEYAHQQQGVFDLILVTGDLTQKPSPESYQRIFQILSGYRTRCMCLPGNHDDFGLMSHYLNSDQISCEKLIRLNNWQIIGLNSQIPNSAAGELAAEELFFLKDALRTEPALPTLIAVHHPCFAIGSIWLDTMQIQNSTEFLTLIEPFPQVKAVTCGHVHQDISTQINQVKLFATPASCFQFTPKSNDFSIEDASPGYRTFELWDDGSLKTECHRLPIKMTTLDRSVEEY